MAETNKTIINVDSLNNLPSKAVKLIRHDDSLDSEKACKKLNDELSADESMEDSQIEKDTPDIVNSTDCEIGTTDLIEAPSEAVEPTIQTMIHSLQKSSKAEKKIQRNQ